MKMRKILSYACLAAIIFAATAGNLDFGANAKPTLPAGATLGETDPKTVMTPGTVDWVIGTRSERFPGSSGGLEAYYTDYAEAWVKNAQDSGTHETNTIPWKYIHASTPSIANRTNDWYYGKFMGYPVYATYWNTAYWCNGGMVYKIQGGAYAAVALLINKTMAAEIDPEDFPFFTSADGVTWTPITPSITLEYDANDPAVTMGKPSVTSVHKAVVKMPDNATRLRVMIPGAGDGENSTYNNRKKTSTGANFGYTSAMIGTLVVSADNLAEHRTLNTVTEFLDPVLEPGTIDNLSNDFYYDYYIRGTWNNTPNYNWNTPAGLADTFNVSAGAGQKFMGQPIVDKIINSKKNWNGSSLVYGVQEKTYVATALLKPQSASEEHFAHYGYEVSEDGSSWSAVTPVISADSRTGAYWDVYKAVSYIPEGKAYYRITLPGFNRAAADGNEFTYGLRDPDIAGTNYFIGPSVASMYDLADYELLTKVPDSTYFIDIKADLRAAILRGDAVKLKSYEDGAAKDAFVAALAAAKDVLNDAEAEQGEIDAATAALEAAQAALVLKSVPNEANIGQSDERRILKPGVYDAVRGSAFKDELGNPIKQTDGASTWYCNYTDYGLSGMISNQENLYLKSENRIHSTSYDFMWVDQFAALSFMGRQIENVYINTVNWAGSYVRYRVYAGSYIASSILVNKGSASMTAWPDVQNTYTFQASADGESWEMLTPSITLAQETGNYKVFKAVVQIPAGKYFYRVVMPGAKTLTPDTRYYAGGPGYNYTFLGPAVASMHDLNGIDDYADVPDACEWYADAALVPTDASKLAVTEKYFKCLKEDMTVAEALAALDPTKGSPAFYTADGVKITDPSTVLKARMKAEILDAKGLSMLETRGIPMLTVASGSDLLSIEPVADIEVENGAPKTAAGLGLPATVKIEAGNGTFDAAVNWNFAAADYDPAVTQAQTFTVTGALVLPNGVTNGGKLDLTLSVKVTVLASTQTGLISLDKSKVQIDELNGYIYIKPGLTLQEIQALLKPVGEVSFYFFAADGSELTDLSVTAEEGMTVDLMMDIGLVGSYEIGFLTDSGAIPSTGQTNILPALIFLLGSAAAVLLAKTRRARR